jgi:1-acyl-sn-glycerol-3-phosphate acyltransferase
VIRTLWVVLNLIVVTIPLCILLLVYSYFGPHHAVFDRIPRFWSQWLLRVSGVKVRFEGMEHVSTHRPLIITVNHVSWYDVLAIAAYLPKRYRFVAKKELARVPLWGRAWQAAGHIGVDRTNRQIAVESLDRAGRLIRADGSAIVIFPEGTRSASGELQPFKKGAFMLALHNGIDIVPGVVIGSRAILPKGGWRVRSGPIIVRFGPPVPVQGLGPESRDTLIARVRSDMENMLAAPAPDDREAHVDRHQHTRS